MPIVRTIRLAPLPFPLLFLLLLALGTTASAQVQEWILTSKTLEGRTTLALERYYSVVKPDSLRLRYISRTGGQIPYRIRGHRTSEDTLGQLLSVTLGQLTLATSSNIRIALGDDLYTDLILSRSTSGSNVQTIGPTEDFGHEGWDDENAWIVALDRIDYRFNPSLGIMAMAGAPESNLPFWSDGTFRLGVESPDWEFALLLPYGAGSTAVGYLQERLLAPGFGAAGRATLDRVTARLRFTALTAAVFASPLAASRTFLHSASGQITYQDYIPSGVGLFRYDGGIGYEEFTAVDRDTSGEPVQNGRVRRLSPVADLSWISPGENILLSVGVADLALRASITARLNRWLWLELRLTGNDILRPAEPFEHATTVFFTPRLKF